MPAAESADPDGRESAADAPVPDVPANGQTDDQTDATVPIETTSVNEETATRAMPQQAANVEDETRPIAQQSAQATQPVQPVPPTQPVPPAQQAPQTQSVPPVQPQYPQQSGFGGQGFQQTGQPYAAQPQQPSAAAMEGRTFFNWLKEALIHPSQDKPVKKWYSWVITLFLSFMIALNIVVWVTQGASFVSQLDGYGSVAVQLFFAMWIAAFLVLYSCILFALLGRKVLADSKKFSQFHDEYARRLMPWVMLELIVFVLSIIRLTPLALLLQCFGLFSMWQPVVVAQGQSQSKRDPHWGWLIAMIVQLAATVIAIIIVMIVSAMLASFAAGMAHSYYY